MVTPCIARTTRLVTRSSGRAAGFVALPCARPLEPGLDAGFEMAGEETCGLAAGANGRAFRAD